MKISTSDKKTINLQFTPEELTEVFANYLENKNIDIGDLNLTSILGTFDELRKFTYWVSFSKESTT